MALGPSWPIGGRQLGQLWYYITLIKEAMTAEIEKVRKGVDTLAAAQEEHLESARRATTQQQGAQGPRLIQNWTKIWAGILKNWSRARFGSGYTG